MNPSGTAAANKALVSQVMDAVFGRRDSSVVERDFAKPMFNTIRCFQTVEMPFPA
jgi:hypothetical protein